MVRLSRRDYELVIELLPTLYAPTEAANFPHHSLHVVRALIPSADDAAWIVFGLERTPRLDTWIALGHPVGDTVLRRMESGLASHPFTQNVRTTLDPFRVLRLSEFPKSVRDRHRAEYADVYRALDIGDGMMAIVEVGGGQAAAVTLSRTARDFSERDCLVLALIRNHLRRARANAQLRLQDDNRSHGQASAAERFGLTPREGDVAFWLSHGKTNAEIAMILQMACRTAEKHVEAVLRKLKVENRTSAALALRRG